MFCGGCAGWPAYPWAGMVATVAAIGVLVLEGCITAMFQRFSAPAAPLPPTRDVEMSDRNGNKDVTTAYVHGHGYSQGPSDDPKAEKIKFLTIAQACPAAVSFA